MVEDDSEVRAVTGSMLEGLGYRVLTADHAKAGLAALERAPEVYLLLSDIALPGGDSGPRMVDEIRHRRPDLKVFFMSGHGGGVMANGDRLARGGELLMKPFRRHQLAQRVRAMLDDAGS